MSVGCNCCGAVTCGAACVTLVDQCVSGNVLSGGTVTVYTQPVTAVTRTAGGSGYTNGSYTNGTFSGGTGSGGAFSYTVVGGVIQPTITVTSGGSYATAPTPVFNAGAFGSGAAATATLGPATTVGTCTTSGMVTAVTRTNGGSGYTNGSYTNGTFTGGGGSGATFNYTVSGGVVQTTFTVTNPGSGYTSAPTPVISAGSGTGFAATATLRGGCCVATPANGPYNALASYSGYANGWGNLTIASCLTSNISVNMSWYAVIIGTSCPSGAPLPGVQVAVTQSGTSLGTFTTDSAGYTGHIPLAAPFVSGTFGVVLTHPRWVTRTINNTSLVACRTSGGANTFLLTTPATGYVCFRNCAHPVATTLYLTDPVWGGPVTLTWNPSYFGGGAWVGTQAVSYAGGGGCPATTLTITYFYRASGPPANPEDLGVQWNIQGSAPNCPDDTGTGTIGFGVIQSSLTCPPSFSVSLPLDLSTLSSDAQRVYGSSGTVTWTITE